MNDKVNAIDGTERKKIRIEDYASYYAAAFGSPDKINSVFTFKNNGTVESKNTTSGG